MRIETLRSTVEAAGLAMAPSADQFDSEIKSVEATNPILVPMDAGNYSRSWAVVKSALAPTPAAGSLWHWLAGRRATPV
jgi:hypothetical protein